MKALKFILIVVFVVVFVGVKNADAQAIVIRDNVIFFTIPHPYEDSGKVTFESISSKSTISSSGKIVKTATFELPKNNFLVPPKGRQTIIGANVIVDGITLTDERVVIKSSGKFKLVFHLNGAGANLPVGWQ